MRRIWLNGLVSLGLLLAGGLALDLYRTHQQVQGLGQEVYKELDGDGFPVPAGVLDDPVFQQLPPPDQNRPVSLGRYKPPENLPQGGAPTGDGETPAPTPTPPEPAVSPAPAPNTTPPETTPSLETASPATPSPAVTSAPVRARPAGSPPPAQAQATPTRPAAAAPTSTAPAPASVPGAAPRSGPPPATRRPPVAPASFLKRLETSAKLHLLLIANDQETLGSGRGDVLLVLTFDPVAQQLTLLSIPRDTRVDLPEHGLVKINAAYAYGGARLQTEAVERFLGIPMDKYVEISLGGFREAINLVGGVTVQPKFSFQLDGSTFAPGHMTLNGEQALAYARMRKDDPQGDLGRNARQQEVIRNLMGALGHLSTSELQALLDQLSAYLRTNFSPSEVVRLRAVHSYMLDHQRAVHVQGVNRKLNGAWFYLASDAERQRLHLLLR
ncbi:LCP family protein [Deinococcus aerophilus]|uniref:Cell envelope-related transcriptional attenuator domain-containing protein n=1 Tax=Deinococcus aerophilus TaxID=522488 RepID=A0ABQ2GJM1_9DEIO|nr:LCP family protein [Deinococcus aerophilus]GGL98437.1 hypothetical protein GCM10010841_03580 [Deinococcus aerophilus]